MATGFALNIDEKLLKNLERADELVQDIGKHSEQTRDKFNAAFQQMATGSLNDFISKLSEAKRAIADVGSANVQFNGVVNISNQAVKASDDIVNLVSTLAKLKHIMSQMGGENFSAEGLFNMGGATKDLTKELRKDLRATQRWMDKLKESTEAYENSIGNLSADLARAKEAQRSFNEEMKRASKQQAGGLINQQGQARTLNELKAYAKELQKTMANLDPKSSEWEKLNKIYKQTNREIKGINSSMKDMNNTHKSLINTADQLKRAFALVFSVSQIAGYVKNIARVRGEFELQQRSLQAILQNKDEADRLWQQTIQLAVRSPFQVKELVTYTKQLAAYRVESDKLYDTTKMLADVSAGLGVDMNRLILAYGQVKAANYLRGTELRQFSEAGVNILAELAKYFTELEGRAVSVGDVFERVSKRMVTFADVEEIFKRITSEGGVFYNMQEIQAETLKGQISNLRDSVDIMLNDIGKANEHILKGSVNAVKLFVENWQMLVPVLKAIVAGFALTRVNALLAKESIMLMAIDFGVLVNTEQRALTVTQLLNVGWKSFVKNIKNATAAVKAFVASNPWIAALTVAIGVITKLVSVTREHNREIATINEQYDEMRKITRNISVKFTTAADKQDRADMEKQLYRIVELANKEYNMDIKINAKKLDTKELETKFIDIRDKVFNAQAFATAFAKGMQEASKWTLQDDIFEDLTQLGDKASESFTKYRNIVEETIFLLEKRKSSLDANEAQAYDILTNIPKDATQLEYIEKVREAYELLTQEYKDLKQEYKETGNFNLPAQMAIIADQWGINAKEMLDYFDDYDKALNEAKKEFDDFVKTIKLPTMLSDEEKTIRLKTAIDKQASEKNWNDFVRQYMYRWTGEAFKVELDFTPKREDKEPTFDNEENDKQNKLTSKRISLIKEMRREYEQLNKTFDKTVSKEKVIESYTNAVNEAFKGTGISIDDIKFESLEELATSLEGLKDLAAKEGTEAKLALEKAISGVRVQIGVEDKQGEDKKLKQQVEDLFSRYDITLDLEKLGLSKDLMSSLFDVEALDLSGLRGQVESMRDQFIGTDMEDEYKKYLDKITDMETKAQQERLKTYLNYTRNAIGERAKIKLEELRKLADIEKTFDEGSPEKELAKQKVKEEAYQKTQKLEWEEFQKSDTFISLFKDLDMASSTLINHAIEKLNNFKDEWKNMPLEDMRSIVDKINQLEGQLVKINPFAKGRELKAEVKKDGRSVEQIQQDNINKEAKLLGYEQEIAFLEEILRLKEDGNIQDEFAIAAANNNEDVLISTSKEIAEQIQSKKDLAKLTRQDISNNNKALANQQQLKRSYSEQADAIGKAQQMANDLIDSFSELAEVLGADGDGIGMTFVNMGQDMMNTVLNTIMLQAQLNAAAVAAVGLGVAMNTAMGVVGWIVMAVQLLVSLFSAVFKAHDKGLQNQIDKLAVQTEDLQEKFESLSESIDNAYDTTKLQKDFKEADKVTKEMIANYEKMIQLEEDKKKTDEDAIKDYEENIEAQKQDLEDLKRDAISKATAGIFDDTLSAARDFVDAWYDAFKETGDGLKGLEDNFEEMFLNLVKQQAAMQIVGRFAKQWERDLSKYINEKDTELTKAEAQEWAEKVKATFGPMNDALKNYLGVMDEIVGSTGELSGLEKGIAGASEETVQVVAAYLNSLRFFVADNNSVMKQLRDYVIGTDDNVNPMLAQLRIIAQQTSAMRTLLDSVTQSGHPKGQSGIRVFVD